MIKHIILWKLKEDIESGNIPDIKQNAKTALEELNGKIDGLNELRIVTDGLPTSNADMMLLSVFKNTESLSAYQKSTLHNAAADKYIRPYIAQRLCLDFEE